MQEPLLQNHKTSTAKYLNIPTTSLNKVSTTLMAFTANTFSTTKTKTKLSCSQTLPPNQLNQPTSVSSAKLLPERLPKTTTLKSRSPITRSLWVSKKRVSYLLLQVLSSQSCSLLPTPWLPIPSSRISSGNAKEKSSNRFLFLVGLLSPFGFPITLAISWSKYCLQQLALFLIMPLVLIFLMLGFFWYCSCSSIHPSSTLARSCLRKTQLEELLLLSSTSSLEVYARWQ